MKPGGMSVASETLRLWTKYGRARGHSNQPGSPSGIVASSEGRLWTADGARPPARTPASGSQPRAQDGEAQPSCIVAGGLHFERVLSPVPCGAGLPWKPLPQTHMPPASPFPAGGLRREGSPAEGSGEFGNLSPNHASPSRPRACSSWHPDKGKQFLGSAAVPLSAKVAGKGEDTPFGFSHSHVQGREEAHSFSEEKQNAGRKPAECQT